MAELLLYGERGIVVSLILDIKDDLDRLTAVLRAIDWCGPAGLDWIDEIESVSYIVEPSFSEFGQPDLLIVCHLADKSRRCLIIEVKVTPYCTSAKSNKVGMEDRNYNSSINGQLSLDYRLALALEHYTGGHDLQEPEAIWRQYGQVVSDDSKAPRKLAKPSLIEHVVKRLLAQLKLSEILFVAVTQDSGENPMEAAKCDKRPPVLIDEGHDQWAILRGQFGHLSLEKLDSQVLSFDGHFRRACRLFIGPFRKERLRDNDFPGLRTKRWEEFPEQWVENTLSLARRIKDNASRWCQGKRHAGSYSFVVQGKVVGKLVLRDPGAPWLSAGFSAAIPGAQEFARRLASVEARRIQHQPFYMAQADPVRGADEICKTMTGFLMDAYETLA